MMRTRHAISLADLAPAVAAGMAVAKNEGWAVTIAIVDDSGHLVHLSRMDEATPASIDTATGKARSAALTGIDTKLLEDMVKMRPALVSMERIAVEGGLPLIFQGQRVGGVGVSGVQSHQDRRVAEVVVEDLAGRVFR